MNETLNNNNEKNAEVVNEIIAAFSSKAENEALQEFKKIDFKEKAEEKQEDSKEDAKHEVNKETHKEGSSDQKPEKASGAEASSEDYESLYKKIKKDSEDKEKRANDNLRYSRQLSNTLGNVKNHIASLEESGEIDEDTASSLREIISKHVFTDKLEVEQKNDIPPHLKDETELINKAKDALMKYVEVAPNSEVEQKYAVGFDNHLNMLNAEDRKKTISDLKKLSDSPKTLLKEMLSIGEEFWKTPIGKGLDEHGNFIDLVYAREEQIETLNKEIETLKKKLNKEIDRDNSVVGSPGPSQESHTISHDPGSMMKKEFDRLGLSDAYKSLVPSK